MTGERLFPVLFSTAKERRGLVALGCPEHVPWPLLAPHEEQAQRNHGQTLQRLAERGGLGPDEMCAIIENRKWRSMSDADAVACILAAIRARFLGGKEG